MKNTFALLAALFIVSAPAFANPAKTELRFKPLSAEDIANGYGQDLDELQDLCYVGEASGVEAAIDAEIEKDTINYWSTVLAIRYGTAKKIVDTDIFAEDAKGKLIEIQDGEPLDLDSEYGHPAILKQWNAFNTKSKDVLVLSNIGMQGDGTEMYATVIPPCKAAKK